MKKNIGTQEAHIRTIVAVILLLIALFIDSAFLKILLAVVSAVLASTSFLRTCPLYTVLGKNTYDGGEPVIIPPVVSVPAEEEDAPQDITPEHLAEK